MTLSADIHPQGATLAGFISSSPEAEVIGQGRQRIMFRKEGFRDYVKSMLKSRKILKPPRINAAPGSYQQQIPADPKAAGIGCYLVDIGISAAKLRERD